MRALIDTLRGSLDSLPVYMDLLAVLLGGLAGSLRAVGKGFPITGVVALAVAAGLGGGILRDVLLNVTPAALTNPSYLPTVLAAAAIGFFFGSLVVRFGKLMLVMDAVWLGLYAVVGAEKALGLHFSAYAAILVGSIAATGGGVLMNLLAGERPQLVERGPIGHFGALIGAVLYVVMIELGVRGIVAKVVTIAAVFIIRIVALRYGIQAPTPVDLPQKISEVTRRSSRKKPTGAGTDSDEANPEGRGH